MDDGTYGRHGLCSSSSWLDGVPFKIGPKFRPPPKVIYQPIIESTSRNQHDEYTFQTEEAVLAWAKAREEAVKKASEEQAEKALSAKRNEEAEQADKDAKAENATHVKDGNNSAPVNTIKSNDQDKSEAKPPTVAAKPLVPKKLHEPGAILKPTPIQHSNKNSNPSENDCGNKSVSQQVVDVSMFESVADPFDTLELQTIDDMEELKVLLDPASSSNHPKQGCSDSGNGDNSKPSDSNKNTDSSEGFYDLAAPVSMDNWVKFEDNTFSNTNNLQTTVNKLQEPSTRSSESPVSDDIGEYVDISDEACLNSKTVNGVSSVEPTKSDSYNLQNPALAGSSDASKLKSAIYKPVLPPISHNHVKTVNGGDSSTSDFLEQNATPSAVVFGTSSVSFSNSPGPVSSAPKPARPAPLPPTLLSRHLPPTSSPKDSQSSSPRQSLTNSMEGEFNSGDELIVNNPYSRHSSNTNPSQPGPAWVSNSNDISARNGSPQLPTNQLNRYSPLPPAPAPKPKEIGLTDPYHSLSRESQGFVDRVTSMGFRRAKVARAVEKFGQDEKEVLDHLFAVDLLVEKKYAPIHAEAALQSCKNDLNKAEKFLQLQVQLEQLGFSSNAVRNALVTSEMDHDKALDILTA